MPIRDADDDLVGGILAALLGITLLAATGQFKSKKEKMNRILADAFKEGVTEKELFAYLDAKRQTGQLRPRISGVVTKEEALEHERNKRSPFGRLFIQRF